MVLAPVCLGCRVCRLDARDGLESEDTGVVIARCLTGIADVMGEEHPILALDVDRPSLGLMAVVSVGREDGGVLTLAHRQFGDDTDGGFADEVVEGVPDAFGPRHVDFLPFRLMEE